MARRDFHSFRASQRGMNAPQFLPEAQQAEGLIAEQSEELENALWAALRSLEENAALSRRMAARASERNHTVLVMQFEENARRVEQHAAVIRQVLHNSEKAPVDD